MYRLTSTRKRAAGVIVPALLMALAWPSAVRADNVATLEPWTAGFPRVIFLIERAGGTGTRMNTPWYGKAGNDTRWEVAEEAIIAAMQSAPPEMEFAIVGTTSGGFLEIAPFDMPRVEQIRELQIAAPLGTPNSYIAEAHWDLQDYLDNVDPLGTGFDGIPYEHDCTQIDVIVLGDGLGSTGDDAPPNEHFVGDTLILGDPGHPCNTTGVPHEDKCTLLDDSTFHHVNNDVGGIAGMQTVRTHTILLDADNLGADEVYSEMLFHTAAAAGAGIYTEANHPGEVAVGISLVMSELLRSKMAVTGAFTSATGHRMFQGWNEVWGHANDWRGVPLFRGHLEAFQLNLDPNDATYELGQVINHGATANGGLWDAGQILASRIALEAEVNTDLAQHCYDFDYDLARTLFTNDDEMGPGDDDAGDDDAGDDDTGDDDTGPPPPSASYFQPRDLIPFDREGIDSHNLGDLLLDYQPFDAECAYEYDFNRDCQVDALDAQELVDFLRGVRESHYGYGGTLGEWPTGHVSNYAAPFLDRGAGYDDGMSAWKLGSMFLSEPAFADNLPPIVTDDPAFFEFLQAIATRQAVLYVAANDGFLHAFRAPPIADNDHDGFEDYALDGNGGWELWGYVPRHLVDKDSLYHTENHRMIRQKLDGESQLHDGSVNLTYLWMDDIPNGIVVCDGAAAGEIDPSGCEYHRVLVVSMGMGSRYHYALDVTDPCRPRFLWEWIGDADDIALDSNGWGKGLSTGTPVIGEVLDSDDNEFRPVVFWSGGTADWDGAPVVTGDDRRPLAKWYMVDLLQPDNPTFSQIGYDIDPTLEAAYGYDFICDGGGVPDCRGRYRKYGSTTDAFEAAPGVFGTPAAVDYDEDGTIDALYVGTRHGFVYKVLIDNGELREDWMEDINCGDGHCGTCVFHEPPTAPGQLANLQNADSDAVFYRPSVAYDGGGLLRVSWGTGWYGNLFETTDRGHMYMVIDENPWECEHSVHEVTGAVTCGNAADPMQLDQGEKIVGPAFTAGGIVFFATYVASDACDVGDARIWALNLDDCTGAFDAATDFGPDNLAVTDSKYVEVEGIPSRFSYSNGGVYVSITGTDGSITAMGPIQPQATYTQSDRIYYSNWRNVF